MKYKNTDLELGLFWAPLHNELIHVEQKLSKSEVRRYKFRTFINMVESISFRIRQILIERYQNDEIKLDNAEVIALMEKKVEISKSGQVQLKEKYFPFLGLFKFTFKVYAKTLNKEKICEQQFSINSFNHFQETIKIRNRIIHPKKTEDIHINDEEALMYEKAHDWFHEFLIKILDNDLLEKQ